MRGPASEDNQPLHEYTLMPAHMRGSFSPDRFGEDLGLAEPFSFTKGARTMKIPGGGMQTSKQHPDRLKTLLWDVETDPKQQAPVTDEATEARMVDLLKQEMQRADAPAEQYERLGLS
jgi:hypothetical protein